MSGRSSSRRLNPLALAVAALLLAECSTLSPPRQPLSPEAHQLIDLLHRRWQEFADLRTLVDIIIRRDDRVQRLTGVLVLRAPASLRFEALTPWGQPFLLLAGNGETVTFYQVADNRALIGPASAKAAKRWLGFPLKPRELVALLAGHVLPVEDPYSAEFLPADDLGPSIKLTGGEGVQRIWADPETGVVRQVELNGEKNLARVTYAGGGWTEPPAAVTLTALDSALTVTIRYRQPRLGTAPSPELFTITLPADVKVRRFR